MFLQADYSITTSKINLNSLSPEQAAQMLAAAGISFIPIKIDGSKSPSLESWKEYQERHPTADELTGWFGGGKTRGIAAIGGAVSGGLEIVDLDAPDLREEFESLIEEHIPGLLHRLVIVETPKGGRHYYYRCDKTADNQKLARGTQRETFIETRGDGGYVLAPGCPARCHPLKKQYRFLQGDFSTIPRIKPDERDVLHNVARTFGVTLPSHTPAGGDPRERNADASLPGVDFSNRATIEDVRDLLESAGWVRLGKGRNDSELWRRPGKESGGCSASLFTESRVFYVHSTNAFPFESLKGYPPFGVYALIKHDGDFKAAATALRKEGFGKQDPAPTLSDIDLDAILTDQGNAEAIIQQFGDDLRFVPSNREFMVWDGKRWASRNRAYLSNLAVKTAKGYLTKAGEAGTPVDVSIKYAKHGKKSLSRAAIDAVISLCENFEDIHLEAGAFNPDPHLLNVANGTIDLRTGDLLPHDKSRMIRSMIPIEYDPEAKCPTWERSLQQIFNGNDELVTYIQRYAGYTATGETSDQTFLILYGAGANGKSVMLNALASVLGDYHKATRAETLMIKRGDNIPNDVADLWGARFVSAIETEAGSRMAQSLVKSMSGGDKMKARFLYKEFFEFVPQYKLWLAVNHKPVIDGSDDAMIRRVRLIPFDVKFEKLEENPDTQFIRDDDLPKKWKAEYPGILRWIVEGAMSWYEYGMTTPDAVKAATKAYASEMDTLKAFIDDQCVLGYDYNIRKTQLVEAYTTFCAENNETPIKGKALHERMIRMGFTDSRTNKDRFWKGLALNVRNSE